jgi:uncharacterized protein (DUF1501 family)
MLIPSRRNFLQISCRSLASLSAAGLMSRFGQVNALAQSTCPTDYKALVCVFLFGGNDGNNTVVPISTPSGNPNNSYSVYSAVRQGLALPQAKLLPIATSKGDQYGLHPSLVEVAGLYQSKNIAVLANVGTLVAPLTKTTYQKAGAAIPLNLFSHLDQQTEWQSALAQGFAPTGWGGRVADVMQRCNNPLFPTIVSVGGNSLFATGAQTNPAAIAPGQPLGLQGFAADANSTVRLAALQSLLTFDNGVSLVQAANTITKSGVDEASLINQALQGAKAFTTVFPATSIGQQLQQVAQIIQVRTQLGMHRQIFFAFLGGFDTHQAQLTDQANVLQQLSQALKALYSSTQEMGVDRQVMTFTESDFGRTFQPSGGATLGSDHAWGSHHFIMGGGVKGGDLYGTFPTLAMTGPDDANNRGVWIPTTPLDQYGATLASWFGVDAASLGQVFPNLTNFKTPLPAFV